MAFLLRHQLQEVLQGRRKSHDWVLPSFSNFVVSESRPIVLLAVRALASYCNNKPTHVIRYPHACNICTGTDRKRSGQISYQLTLGQKIKKQHVLRLDRS